MKQLQRMSFIKNALKEDIGPGDITTENLVPETKKGEGVIVAKEALVVAGLEIAGEVFRFLDADMDLKTVCRDGDAIAAGDTLLNLSGSQRAMLMAERTALNILQRLSGIATLVRSYVDIIGDYPVRLVDTRKTTPGLRTLEKYAVRIGGAANHRYGLFDGVLIKDNHIAACGGITPAVEKARRAVSHLVKIEVEVSDTDQVKEALTAGADVIMLDNMEENTIRESVRLISGRVPVEVSGGVTRKNLVSLCQTGVDIISVGALTHSARSVDISMRIR